MIERILRKIKYVKELERQLEALNIMYERDMAAGRNDRRFLSENVKNLKNQLEETEKAYRDLNRLTACIISEPHTIYGSEHERHVNVTRREFEAAAGLEVEIRQVPPYKSYMELRVKVTG